MKKHQTHKTSHTAEASADGKVMAYCEGCGWREFVDVSDLSYMEVMRRVFDARDAHEAEYATTDGRAAAGG